MVNAWVPLGAALLAFHEGDHQAEILVSSDYFADERVAARSYYRPDDEVLPELEIHALRRCHGRVLDLGAGAGRHALELQGKGHNVLALDVAEDAVKVMRCRGVRDARLGRHSDLVGETFDTVLMLMNGIGLAGDLRGLRDLLTELRPLLAPGGQILCDSADLGDAFDPEAMRSLVGLKRRSGYPGEVTFRLSFGRLEGATYPWLFVDWRKLSLYASEQNLVCEVLAHGSRGSYLARLS